MQLLNDGSGGSIMCSECHSWDERSVRSIEFYLAAVIRINWGLQGMQEDKMSSRSLIGSKLIFSLEGWGECLHYKK